MDLQDFNKLDKEAASKMLFSCCGSTNWVKQVMEHFPFRDESSLVAVAEDTWYNKCTEADWRESFTHHPKIGDVKSLTEKFAGKEQAAVGTASVEVIEALAKANQVYEEKHGFIFIVCATGKSAEEMLRLLNDRLKNSVAEELSIAMGEQHKISIIRFKKMLNTGNWSFLKVSQVTTHVLDTSIGRPGKDISIRMKEYRNNSWQTITQGVTNADGRIADLLPPSRCIQPGHYKMVFETGEYFKANNLQGFYPVVEIDFSIFDNTHYHVPLLINPFGYSTYRGS